MNIWILNHYAVVPDMPGGTRHYDLAKELVKRKYKVTIFAAGFHYSLHKELKLTQKEKFKIENVDGINFVWIKTFPYQKNDWRRVINMVFYMWRAYWLGRKITKINQNIQKPNVIIGSSVHLLAVLAAYKLTKYYKAKFIMEVRDLWPQTLIDIGKSKKHSLLIETLRFLEKFLYKRAKKIITLLPLAKVYISSRGINENKIVWIPNGVNLTRLKNIEGNIEGETNEQFKIMYLGAHGLANALNIVLDAAKIVQDKESEKIKFVFVGDGPEKKNLTKHKDELRLKNVEFRSSVPKEQIYATLNKADIFVFNLKKSAVFKYGISSNKLFDYMATAKPIIFSAEAGNNPIKESGCGISTLPENPSQIAEAIIKLYQMPLNERRQMGLRGRQYVEKYHSMPALVDKLEKVIREVSNE